MKILFKTEEGYLIAAECTAVGAAMQSDDDKWCVRYVLKGHTGWDTMVGGLTEVEAKRIVRRLFDMGVYVPDVHDVHDGF